MYNLKNMFMFCLHLDLERQTYNFFKFYFTILIFLGHFFHDIFHFS